MILFPPILEEKRTSIAAQQYSQDFQIPITLPRSLDINEIGHVQVLIRRQIDMKPWIAPGTSFAPEKDVLYLPKEALLENAVVVQASALMPFIAGDDIPPFSGTSQQIEEAIARQSGRWYSIQVRFGTESLWSNESFASWKARQIAQSQFGEWSNQQKMYCYGLGRNQTEEDLVRVQTINDVLGRIDWVYLPISQDPLAQVRISYSWETADNFGNSFRAKNVDFRNTTGISSGASGRIETNVMRLTPIIVSIEFTTINNTIFIRTFNIDIFDFNAYLDSAEGNFIEQFPITGEEIEDGVLGMTFVGAFRERSTTTPVIPGTLENDSPVYYKIYRIDLASLETIELTRLYGTLGHPFSQTIRDYSVEMGAEYGYVAVSYNSLRNDAIEFILVDIEPLTLEFWNPIEYQGYGRQLDFNSNIFFVTRLQQLKLQGNIEVSGLRQNVQDQITPTIGSPYPFYSRSTISKYRSMSISALITLNFDQTHTFLRFEVSEGEHIIAAKNRIAQEYRDTIEALDPNSSSYSAEVKLAQQVYYDKLTLIFGGINPPPVPDGEPDVLERDWLDGQLWFLEDDRNHVLKIKGSDYLRKENKSNSTKRVMDTRGNPAIKKEKLINADDLYGETWLPAAQPIMPIQLRGPTSRYSQYLRNDIVPLSRNGDTAKMMPEDRNKLVFAERKFRDTVMNWVSDGKPKLIRSETEGNMIVVITSATFTPFNRNRQVYTMSATVTEIAEYNMENLLKYNLVPTDFTPFPIPDIDFIFVPGEKDPSIVEPIYEHDKLDELDWSIAGHTGFMSEPQGMLADTALQYEVDPHFMAERGTFMFIEDMPDFSVILTEDEYNTTVNEVETTINNSIEEALSDNEYYARLNNGWFRIKVYREHKELINLSYAASGHFGFMTERQGNYADTALQYESDPYFSADSPSIARKTDLYDTSGLQLYNEAEEVFNNINIELDYKSNEAPNNSRYYARYKDNWIEVKQIV